MKTESQIEAQLVRYCRDRSIYTRKFSSPSHRGVPDRICIKAGVVIFLELKRPGNVATALQMREIQLLREQRVHAFVATGFTQARTILEQFMPAAAADSL